MEMRTRRWDQTPDSELGWGSKVNGMLVEAPGALVRGHAFKMSAKVCPVELRDRDDCFFQPVSACASEVRYTGIGPFATPKDDAQRYAVEACRLLNPSNANCSNHLEAWRQVARVVLKVQPDVLAAVKLLMAPFDSLQSAAYAACHIRRTDKLISEAIAVPVCRYATQVAVLSGRRAGLQVYIATDDLTVVNEFASCSETQELRWKLRHAMHDPGRGATANVTYWLWAEVSLLVGADWVVGTFSSNVGRLIQVLRTQDEGSFVSVDDAPERAHFPRI